jgi:hypothetical protein
MRKVVVESVKGGDEVDASTRCLAQASGRPCATFLIHPPSHHDSYNGMPLPFAPRDPLRNAAPVKLRSLAGPD